MFIAILFETEKTLDKQPHRQVVGREADFRLLGQR